MHAAKRQLLCKTELYFGSPTGPGIGMLVDVQVSQPQAGEHMRLP